MKNSALRIGCGSGYAEDRIELAEDMIMRGDVRYVSMDCLAERTLALAQLRRLEDSSAGYDLRMTDIAEKLVPVARKKGVTLIGNFGAANPPGAADLIVKAARRLGLKGLMVACVTGDDVLDLVKGEDCTIKETGQPVSRLQGQVVSANAYIGADPIVEALGKGADVVCTGRAADPSLFLAPMMYEFGWATDDWHHKGAGTVPAHLLECGVHVTGGNFADPPYRVVPNLVDPSMPLVEMQKDGSGIITKLPDTGGLVSVETCKIQLSYEIHDPTRYLTPDVTANFADARLEKAGPQRVQFSHGTGTKWPERLKVLVGVQQGWFGEGQVSYAGPRALERARLAESILRARIARIQPKLQDLRLDLMGVNAIHGPRSPQPKEPPYEVHVRVACRTMDKQVAAAVSHEAEYLQVFGPAGTGGHRKGVRPVLAVYSAFLPRKAVKTRVQIVEA